MAGVAGGGKGARVVAIMAKTAKGAATAKRAAPIKKAKKVSGASGKRKRDS
jgi:hypothetical protein